MAAVWISKRDAVALVAAAQGPDVVSRSCARSTLALWVRRSAVRTKDGERPAWAKRPRQLYRRSDVTRECARRLERAPATPIKRDIGPRAWRLPAGDPRLAPPLRPTG